MDYKILFLSQLLFGALVAVVARSRGRTPWIWFIVGMMFTWIGLLILYILPSFVPNNLPLEKDVPKVIETSKQKNEWESTTEWFYLDEDKVVQGPLSAKELKHLWNERKISLDMWVWHEKIIEWKKLHQIIDMTEWLLKTE